MGTIVLGHSLVPLLVRSLAAHYSFSLHSPRRSIDFSLAHSLMSSGDCFDVPDLALLDDNAMGNHKNKAEYSALDASRRRYYPIVEIRKRI